MAAPVLHGPIVETLGREIVTGDLPALGVLTLEQLQERFGVSRTVVRESMRILESMNLVQSRRHVGIVVSSRSQWATLDPRVIRWRLAGPGRDELVRCLTELRLAVEPVAAAGAARSATAEDRDRLLELAAVLRRTARPEQRDEFLEADTAFHTLVLLSSGNSLFSGLVDLVSVGLVARAQEGLVPTHLTRRILDGHEAVAVAVRDRDSAGAELAMTGLMAELRKGLRY